MNKLLEIIYILSAFNDVYSLIYNIYTIINNRGWISHMNKNTIQQYFIALGIGVLVCAIWQGLELAIEGQITHRSVDNIVGLILVASLYWNFRNWANK